MEEFEIYDGELIRYNEVEGKTSVTVPNGIYVIGGMAFLNCGNLKTVILPEGIKMIGESAFLGCKNLTSITLPENIEIKGCIFKKCENLTILKTSEQVFCKLDYDDKYLIISNFTRQYNTENIYTEDDINRYKRFMILSKEYMSENIKKQIQLAKVYHNTIMKMFVYLSVSDMEKQEAEQVENQALQQDIESVIKEHLSPIIKNIPLLDFICNNMDNAFTVEELDELIKVSVKMGEVESTALLLNYKKDHFGFKNHYDDLTLDDDFNENLGNSK